MPSERLIPIAAMEQLIKNAGADRVSESAKTALKEVLEEHGMKLSKQALKLAEHAGRKTIKSEDIKLAAKELKQ